MAPRVKSAPRKEILTLDVALTAKALKAVNPDIQKLYLVGSRLRRRVGRDLDFVALTDHGSMVGRNQTTQVGNFKVNLFYTDQAALQSTILEFGLGLDVIRWKKEAKKHGYTLNRYGLWKGSRIVTQAMMEIAYHLGMAVKHHLIFTLENPY